MKITKITALLIGLVMLMSLFTACDSDPIVLQAEAAVKLTEAPYIMTIKTEYECDNEDVNELLQASADYEMKMNMDGQNFIMSMNAEGQSLEYVFADNVLYMEVMGMKMKTEVDSGEVEEMVNTAIADIEDMNVDIFKSVETEKTGAGYTITCKGLKTDDNDMVEAMLEVMEAVGASVNLDKENFSYVISIDNDGRYESMVMDMAVSMTVSGESINISYKTNIGFEYENAVKVTAPADADEYMGMDDFGF